MLKSVDHRVDLATSSPRTSEGLVGVGGLPRRLTAAALVDYFHAADQSLRALPVITVSSLCFVAGARHSNPLPCVEETGGFI